jgi:hypothetical protein
MQQRMMEMMLGGLQRELEPSEDEWKVIQPLLSEVLKLQFSQMRGLMGGMGPMGGMGARGGGPRPSSGQPEVDALRDAAAAPSTSPQDLKAKMIAVRDARKKNEEALRKAREELRNVLSLRQEAKLLLAGMLD